MNFKKYETLYTPGTEKHYHHWVVSECTGGLIEDYLKNNSLPDPGICVNNEIGLTPEWAKIFTLCRKVSLVWAVGSSDIQDFPEHLAYPIGGSKDDTFKYFFLQIHYDNPNQLPSIPPPIPTPI